MLISNSYNHLNAREFLIVNKPEQYAEIQQVIASIDSMRCLKISCDSSRLGDILYNQSLLNDQFVQLFHNLGWSEKRVYYYVTGDEATTRDIVFEMDRDVQKDIITSRGFECYSTYNQTDFQKDRISIEVQLGKYFSVAYDLHVKHTFFYSRNDMDVGIEIIPTKRLEERMDTGVAWFENEVTNVIREGRTNPPVPVLILGIEPERILSRKPEDYTDAEIIEILRNSDFAKFREHFRKKRNPSQALVERKNRFERLADFV